MANNIQLDIKNVNKAYGSLKVLDNIHLQVSPGTLCTVVGPSGCGKSTLLRHILGAEEPDSGTILIDGEKAGTPDLRRGIVFQKYSLYPHMSVLKNVMLGPLIQAGFFNKSDRADIKDRAIEMLKRVRLAGHENKYPHELSGGMRQRVAIAQSMIMQPKMLLMDEPFGALDPNTREDLQLYLLETWEETKTTVFFVTHDLEEAAYLGTRLLAMSKYYSDERNHDDPAKGAKIVYDIELARKASGTEIKMDGEFRDLIMHVREQAFDPMIRQHIKDFDMRHPLAFHHDKGTNV
ncbi:ABC transporter ATP-binding protein [Sedimenticola sp.]|uniref:ABC transporter ATP-binding protein n=1 Tax=Sedimenticola sp. TaxID=1940285 RepID=UPI003D0A493F